MKFSREDEGPPSRRALANDELMAFGLAHAWLQHWWRDPSANQVSAEDFASSPDNRAQVNCCSAVVERSEDQMCGLCTIKRPQPLRSMSGGLGRHDLSSWRRVVVADCPQIGNDSMS